jgi:hypothetical protein
MTSPVKLTQPVRLDDLIAAIEHVHEDVLDQVGDAILTAEALDEVGDHLIGHFVDRARRSGASWSAIGASMGVSKQAAQKRFRDTGAPTPLDPDQGFARFTGEARSVVVAAQNEAGAARSAVITPVHLVLGLLAVPDSTAGQVLAQVGATADRVRAEASSLLPPPAETVPTLIPFDGAARQVLEHAFQEAIAREADQVGAEHVLLALLDLGHGAPLPGLGVTPELVPTAAPAGEA